MTRYCDQCGEPFEAVRAKLCSPKCRKRSSRGMSPLSQGSVHFRDKTVTQGVTSISNGDNSVDNGDNSLVAATRKKLEAAGVADSMEGQQALSIAAQMSGRETAGGMASLSKELSRVMAEAMRSAVAAMPDQVDELAKRREEKMAG